MNQTELRSTVETCIREHLDQDVDRDNAIVIASQEIVSIMASNNNVTIVVEGGCVTEVESDLLLNYTIDDRDGTEEDTEAK